MSTADDDRLVTVSDALRHVPVSRTWLYDALNQGRVEGVRFGRAWRIRASVVADLVRHGAPSEHTKGLAVEAQ
jgi:hypothetical protein